jgi:Ca2+-binding EF-hand superfamily protein
MKNFTIFVVLMSLSICSFADHHPRGKDLFKRFDADGDGKISSVEHEKVIAEMATKRRQRFAEMDADGDGFVTKKEAKAAADKKKQRLEGFKEKRDQRFEKMDSNGDGVISKDEAQQFNWR